MDQIGVHLRHGIDMVDISRFKALLSRHGEKAVNRLFTDGERDYCKRFSGQMAQHFAVRFAAKEAVLKALGTGLGLGMRWRDVEIQRGESGEPSVVLHGRVREVFEGLGLSRVVVSLTHTEHSAVASVLLMG
ncbi:MAG: holo-ACP synthase [Verrucomicrobiae bacterium]|nr:holo-ACP synthase [Verrucomicrobiae bacterium]